MKYTFFLKLVRNITKKTLAEEFLQFCRAKGGASPSCAFWMRRDGGCESISIDNQYIVPGNQLQLRGDRYYFKPKLSDFMKTIKKYKFRVNMNVPLPYESFTLRMMTLNDKLRLWNKSVE